MVKVKGKFCIRPTVIRRGKSMLENQLKVVPRSIAPICQNIFRSLGGGDCNYTAANDPHLAAPTVRL